MLEVQEARLENHQGPGTVGNAVPPRLLAGSDGIVRLYNCDEVMARCVAPFSVDRRSYQQCEWLQWKFASLLWVRPQALKLLQGASLQQLVGPRYFIVGVRTRPLYSPTPGLDDLCLVEALQTPDGMKVEAFISMVYQQMKP